MSDADETSSIESTPGTLASDLFSHGKTQLDNLPTGKTNENNEHFNRKVIENMEKVGKDAPESENSHLINPEENINAQQLELEERLPSDSCTDCSDKNEPKNELIQKEIDDMNTGAVKRTEEIVEISQVGLSTINVEFKGELAGNVETMQKVSLEIGEKQENLESIQKENHDIKIKLTELEKLKEKTEQQLKIVEESHRISLSKIVNLEGRLAENNAKNMELTQNVNNLSKKLENTERELQFEQGKLKTILNEKNDLVQKYEKVNNKTQIDNVNHINMYQVYERKIVQMKTEIKQVKDETVRLNNILQAKEEIVNQFIGRINQLENQLKVNQEENNKLSRQLEEKSNNLENFKLEYNNKQNKSESLIQQLTNEIEKNKESRNLEEKEYRDKLDNLNNEMKDKIEEYLSNIYSIIKENNLLTPVSIDLSNKINDLDLSISNILEKFYTNLKIIDENFVNDFKSNFSKILIIKKNLELLNKIDSIDADNPDNDEIGIVSHINIYQMYERKIGQIKAENKQIKNETVNLNKMLQTKKEIVNQFTEKINQLENQLSVSQEKEYHINLECINNEMKDKIEEYLSNIYSIIKENNLLTPVSIDLSNKINDLDLSISNILEKFYTNLKIIDENFVNDFKRNFSKILIVKRNLELLNKIDSIDVDNSDNDAIDNVSHINMYQIYEHKFGQMQAKIVNQFTEKIIQSENQLSVSQEEINDKSENSVEKEYHINLECINNEMKEKIEEYLSNIYSIIKENDLLTPISIDLSIKINDLDLSISNILEKFYTNFQNDFKSNFSKILIIKRNLELLNKIDSINVGNSGIDEIDSNSNFNEIQNFFDSIEFLNHNLSLKITDICNDFKLTHGKSIVLIKEIDNENMNKLSTYVKDNFILIKNLLNERNVLKEKLVELKRSVIECIVENEVSENDNLGH